MMIGDVPLGPFIPAQKYKDHSRRERQNARELGQRIEEERHGENSVRP